MNSLELFAGCGGLAYGISEAGFDHKLIVELESHAFSTLLLNKTRRHKHVVDWTLLQSDVRDIEYDKALSDTIDLVSGGPPCQPFSIGGVHKGPTDIRNMWPEAIRSIRESSPKGFVFENVRGLLRPAFSDYLHYVVLQLSYPGVMRRKKQSDREHYGRLLALEKKKVIPDYRVLVRDINTADYGAPQKRQRALIVGVRTEFSNKLIFPEKTHSKEALLWAKYVSGEYWETHNVLEKDRSIPNGLELKLLAKLDKLDVPAQKPWVTVRETINDLPNPTVNDEPIANHVLHPGARTYVGHTGSGMDEPAKALKAGSHGVPGGENVLVNNDGSVRYFTIREMARLQGLPDGFVINGAWVNSIRQLGNAVPVQVGKLFGTELLKAING